MIETIVCRDCAVEKPVEQFNFRNKKKGIRVYQCKSCQSAYNRQHYLENEKKYKRKATRNRRKQRNQLRKYATKYLLKNPCVDCGETNPLILDFDHVRGKKRKAVSVMISEGWSLKSIKDEIAKCEVRCANCHRIKTAKEQNWAILALIEQHNL